MSRSTSLHFRREVIYEHVDDHHTEAAQTRIERQVAPSSPATVQDALRVMEMASKGGVDELKRMIEAP